jgi:CheY-like chemotaxis protein
VKFTEKGFVKFSAELLNEDDEKQKVRFSVTDTGVGIATENLESIFQLFIQEDSSVSRKYGGTGLGLSISREIVSKLGGSIQVHSEKGKGSEFYFVIDLEKGVINEEVRVEPKTGTLDSKKIHILVAEDNAMNQTLIHSIFKQFGVSYDLVENGQEVLDILPTKHYDIILIDIQMPVMDGITTTKHIRSQLRMDIPIIALTANASSEDEKLYRSIGMNGYLAKPFKKEELFRLINETIEAIGSDHSSNNDKVKSGIDLALYSLNEIQELGGDDESFVLSIVDTFRTSAAEYLDQIGVGLAMSDLDKVRKFAHQLKPSFDILMIKDAPKLIRDLEEEAVSKNPDTLKMELVYMEIRRIIDLVIMDMNSKF